VVFDIPENEQVVALLVWFVRKLYHGAFRSWILVRF
jgi:hypothetical protein